jgi:gliding motility-associated-like protein
LSSIPTLLANEERIYALQISNNCGVSVDSLSVTIDDLRPVLNLEDKLQWCPGDTFILNVLQPVPAEYAWNTGDNTPSVRVVEPGIYSVAVSLPCVTETDVSEVVPTRDCQEAGLYIPNVFTPNGDGINDVFLVQFSSSVTVVSIDCAIYDRWGNQVYYSNTHPIQWDGNFKEEWMQPAVFAYIIHIRYAVNGDEKMQTVHGEVTLVR